MSHTILQYRTFDELVGEATSDLKMYAAEGMIDSSELIKVAQLINKELGLKINPNKQIMVEIDMGKARLPSDFKTLNFALVAFRRQIAERYDSIPDYGYDKSTVEMVSKDQGVIEVIEHKKLKKNTYQDFARVDINPNPRVTRGPARRQGAFIGKLAGQFFEIPALTQGFLYLNYQGSMEDCEGNLLVLDEPIANEYYEYAIKRRVLENLYLNGEDVARKLDLVESRYRPARNNALSLVNTPDFQELKRTHDANRMAMYQKYYKNFEH